MNQRKGAWSFRADWTFPGDGDTPSDLQQLDAKLRLLPLVAERIPHHLINMERKYKLSDWELARTKNPIILPVQGYIQTGRNRAIDLDNLRFWFDATWTPVDHGSRNNKTYLAWTEENPAYRHVQVSGVPAIAKAGRRKKDTEVRRAPASSPSVPFLLISHLLFIPCA